jgi:hypothetical protein
MCLLLRGLQLPQAADKESLKSDVRAFLKLDADKEFVISTADWLGLFDEEPIPAKVTRLDVPRLALHLCLYELN